MTHKAKDDLETMVKVKTIHNRDIS